MTPAQRGRVLQAICDWLDATYWFDATMTEPDDYYPEEQERLSLLDLIEKALDDDA